MERVVVEVISSRKSHCFYHATQGGSLSIGRGFANDIIIPDPFASEQNLVIAYEDGAWIAREIGGENGILINGKLIKGEQVILSSGAIIILGKTELRFYDERHPVADTVLFNKANRLISTLSRPLCAWSLLVLFLTLDGIDSYFRTYETVKIANSLLTALSMAIFIMPWVGFWALLGRILKHRAKFYTHLAITCLFLIILSGIHWLMSHAGYYLGNHVIGELGLACLGLLITCAFINAHLIFASNLQKKGRTIFVSGLATVVVLMGVLYGHATKDDFNPYPRIDTTLKAPYIRLVTPVSIDEFLKSSQELFVSKKN